MGSPLGFCSCPASNFGVTFRRKNRLQRGFAFRSPSKGFGINPPGRAFSRGNEPVQAHQAAIRICMSRSYPSIDAHRSVRHDAAETSALNAIFHWNSKYVPSKVPYDRQARQSRSRAWHDGSKCVVGKSSGSLIRSIPDAGMTLRDAPERVPETPASRRRSRLEH